MADVEPTAPTQSMPTTDDLAEALRLAIKAVEYYVSGTKTFPDDLARAEFALKLLDFVMG